MPCRLPSPESPLRAHFTEREIADMRALRRFVTFREAHLDAERAMRNDPSIRSMHTVCLRADGELWLVRFGPRGGWKREWNFGQLFQAN